MLPADMDKDRRNQSPELTRVMLEEKAIKTTKLENGGTRCAVTKTKNLDSHKYKGCDY